MPVDSDTIKTVATILAVGAAFGTFVWKGFEMLENTLTEARKFEIAVWLVGIELGPQIASWPQTFLKLFERVFGERHVSIKCFMRSAGASVVSTSIMLGLQLLLSPGQVNMPLTVFLANLAVDYPAYGLTRLAIKYLANTQSVLKQFVITTLDIVGIFILITIVGFSVVYSTSSFFRLVISIDSVSLFQVAFGGTGQALYELLREGLIGLFFPAYLTTLWLWVYMSSGFFIRLARRLDLGFQWFNRTFDIEKKPLSAIGLVAGVLVAAFFWTIGLVAYKAS